MNTENFLPEGYKQPDNSDFMKLTEGENTFRVLSSAVVGFKYWTNENKPVRSRTPFASKPDDIKMEKDGKFKISHFWAFLVWNYGAEKVQVLEIPQASIQAGIKALVDNKKWGNPKSYDITITRSGDGLDTEYAVMPNPHTELELDEVADMKVKEANLDALFEGKYPWDAKK